MRSNNPVFNNSPEFNGQGGYVQQGYGYQQGGYPPPPPGYAPAAPQATRTMSIDSVVQSTGISLGVVVLVAAATWVLTGDLNDPVTGTDSQAKLYAASMIGGLAAFALSLVNSFKRQISPALVLAFCAAEGLAMGAISKVFDAYAGQGVVTGAVLGTFGAFAGTLAAYKFLNIKVGDKFRRGVTAAMFGMVGIGLIEMVLSLLGHPIGLFDNGGVGLIFAIGGLVLGVFMLIMDFDFVERGIAYGLPERESWRASFAMTVSLVWIYTNLLRILSILNQD
ncbi:Bax inhibitor-1/YccA family protein [Nocardioides jiangxiensis]|uniref:Bax inhibitor-1/YccA family protein n=1 Tax=Nocardioides jiangxiensis TaxID=3064524 RepID=A0ABT9B1U6_9ACTN|nr:Bax inhibitor-1/YccA family protein [Nocardioides sp. WY-20]MDO7868819.1 Bax inhibitor-1/YccA family protein [Nocardioides sp. WY-20]